jgi:hypothetical protein
MSNSPRTRDGDEPASRSARATFGRYTVKQRIRDDRAGACARARRREAGYLGLRAPSPMRVHMATRTTSLCSPFPWAVCHDG